MKNAAPASTQAGVASRVSAAIADAILGFLGQVPSSDEYASHSPREQSRRIAAAAAAKAALTAGSLALPPGPLGLLTVLPELVTVWRIQAKMVADIAAAYGHTAELSREHMLYCLFRHTAAQALRDLVARAGERLLVRKTSARVLRTIAGKIGVRLTRRVLGEGLSRWLPVLGAVGVGGYAYFDTAQVARTAIEMFSHKVVTEPDGQ